MIDVKREHRGYADDERVAGYHKKWPGRRCWSCEFFDEGEPLTYDEMVVDGEVSGTAYNLDGYCRRHTPQHGFEENGDSTALWPWVGGTDWCGEYSPYDGVELSNAQSTQTRD